MIEISDVSCRLQGTDILAPATLTIPAGKITAMIGPNGAGKSTLLRLIGRIEPLQTGRVAIDGLDLADTSSDRLARQMAFLGQTTMLASRLRVRELVAFGRWPHCHGRPTATDHDAVARSLADFALDDLQHRFMDELSGGQAQRAHLAMTAAQDTPWLLLDEPMNNLDLAHARTLMTYLAALRDKGGSVVIVIHDLNFASGWADHIVAMKDGKIFAQGTPSEVLTSEVLSTLYDTEIAVGEYQGRPLVLHHM